VAEQIDLIFASTLRADKFAQTPEGAFRRGRGCSASHYRATYIKIVCFLLNAGDQSFNLRRCFPLVLRCFIENLWISRNQFEKFMREAPMTPQRRD
jgi:hypothetical protein